VLDFAGDSKLLIYFLGLCGLVVVQRFQQRRWELVADREAATLTGDPAASITGLVKLARLDLQPVNWSKWEAHLLSHPSHSRRLQALARHGGIEPERLEALLALPEDGSGVYELPPLEAVAERIYSPAFKRRRAFVNAWLLILALTLPPALMALVVQHGAWKSEGTVWLILAAGLLLTLLSVLLLLRRLGIRGERALSRQLRMRQETEGLRPGDWGAQCIAFSPGSTLKQYEQTYDCDMGYLYVTARALCYVGEQTRFALRPEQIRRCWLGPGIPRWGASHRIYIAWEITEQSRQGSFNLRPVAARSLTDMERATLQLKERLQAWLRDPSQSPATPEPLLQLQPPALGEVTGTPVHETQTFRTFLNRLTLVSLVGIGVSLLLGLSFSLRAHDLPFGWYVVGVGALTLSLHTLPSWRYRRLEQRRAKVTRDEKGSR